MHICMFIIRFLSSMEKILERWRPKKIEETFFLYDLDTEEIEQLYV